MWLLVPIRGVPTDSQSLDAGQPKATLLRDFQVRGGHDIIV